MSFDPAQILPDPRHAYGPKARLPIFDVLRVVQPSLSHAETWGAWRAFQQAKGLPQPPRAYIPGRNPACNKRRVASTLVADLPTQAALILSLPGDAAHLRRCAGALQEHFGGNTAGMERLPHQPLEPLLVPYAPAPRPPIQDDAAAVDAAYAVVEALRPEAVRASLVFNFGAFCLRALQDSAGQLWFKGKAVATAMGYLHPGQAIRDHVDQDRRAKLRTLTNSTASDPLAFELQVSQRELDETWVQESAVWQLLAASRTEAGKAFNRWWSGEVMPQLRKTGTYSLRPQEPPEEQPPTLQERLQTDLLQAQITGQRLENKKRRLEVARLSREVAAECGLRVTVEQLQFERVALAKSVEDPSLSEDRSIAAADYLRLRGHSDAEVQCLQISYGKLLKKAYLEARGKHPETFTADFGQNECQVCCYDRRADRALMNAAYQAMTVTELFQSRTPQQQLALNSL